MIDLTLFQLAFFQRALIIGLILGVLMAILGVLIVLRRMSFFSDAIGHSALTGIAIGILLDINPFISAFIFSLLVAASISIVRIKSKLALDTLLGVFFSASVALGVILVQLTPGFRSDLIGFLFGDILTVSTFDVYLTIGISIIAGLITIFSGKTFIAIAFNASLAKAEGVAVNTFEMILLLVLAAVIAVSIKLVGIVLVTAMFVIPAATAQNIARSLSGMFVTSAIVSVLSVLIGMTLSVILNTASGPSIVLVGAVFFALSLIGKPLLHGSN